MSPQELQVQRKRELEKTQESTVPARFFVPTTDIFETEAALSLIVEMPGVIGRPGRSAVEVQTHVGQDDLFAVRGEPRGVDERRQHRLERFTWNAPGLGS